MYSPLFTDGNNRKAKKTIARKIKHKNVETRCKEYTKRYKLARYLKRNVRAS